MRKLFLLIPALAITLLANATSTTISSGSPKDNNIRAAINGTADTIYLNPGEYIQENQIHLKRSVVLMAANMNDKPVIQLKYYCDLTGEDSKVELNGLILDGTASGQQAIRVYDNAAGKELRLNNCEFRNFAKATISNDNSTYPLDSCIINNCFFHDNKKSALYFVKSTQEGIQTCHGLIVKNSTFANYDVNESVEYYASVINLETYDYSNIVATDVDVLIDHCTFYNYLTYNTDHCAVRIRRSDNVIVSNCIFAHSTEQDRRATYLYDESNIVTNCLAYHLTKNADNFAHAWGPTVTNCVIADPLFNDLANNKYTYDGNWVTMALSPARGAATDGSDLGDPRWYSAEVLPSTDFVAPYQLVGAKAQITGNLWYNSDNAYLYYNNKSTNGTATWKIHAERACAVGVTLNIHEGSPTVHKLRVNIMDADGNSVGELSEQASTLPGTIAIPAEGDYTITLNDDQAWTSAQVDNITLAYVGGAVVTVPAEELLGTEAVRVDAGHLKVTKLANGDLQYGDNQYPLDEYVYWNINATKLGDMKVTLNVVAPGEGDPSSHEFLVELYSNLNESPISSSAEVAATSGTGARVLPTAINIPAVGNYIVKLTNKKQWSSAILHSVEFEYLGGATITVPANELIAEEAVLVDEGHLRVSKLANGDLQYGDNEYPLQEYVYWNINATKYGRMDVTANVVAPGEGNPSGHQFLVEVYANLNESPIATSAEPASTSATGAVAMPALNIPATGNYIVKLTNQKQWSSAILHSIEFAYAGGEVVDVPGQIVAADAMLLKEDGGTLKMYLDENGDIKYNDNGNNLTEYAQWNINATEAGEMIVTLNVTNSGHLFTVELYEGETLKSSVAEPDANEWHSGNLELENHLTIPAAGSYTIKLINRQQYSGGAIHGITFAKYIAPAGITMSEEDPDNSAWVDKVDGAAVNVTLTRTILAGMYNTLCLPFPVSSTQCKAVFGDDVELLTFNEATLEDGVLTLSFNTANDIWQGTPVLIKTSSDIVNPTFNGVQIKRATPSSTGGTDADFIGTFFPTVLEANKDLFVGQNNTVHFPSTNNPLKGLRAYFHVKSTAAVVKRARIVTPNNMPTEIELVGAENQTLKAIENGQLIIIRDGKKYNVVGVKLQ